MYNRNFLFLLIFPFLFACSDDDKDEIQDYTSFVVQNNTDFDLPTCVAGYQKEGLWIKIAYLGDLKKGDSSLEIVLERFIEEEIYIFSDYYSPRRFDVAFLLKENRRNIFKFPKDFRGTLVTDKRDPAQYPQ